MFFLYAALCLGVLVALFLPQSHEDTNFHQDTCINTSLK